MWREQESTGATHRDSLPPQLILAGLSLPLGLNDCNWKEERSEMEGANRSQGLIQLLVVGLRKSYVERDVSQH